MINDRIFDMELIPSNFEIPLDIVTKNLASPMIAELISRKCWVGEMCKPIDTGFQRTVIIRPELATHRILSWYIRDDNSIRGKIEMLKNKNADDLITMDINKLYLVPRGFVSTGDKPTVNIVTFDFSSKPTVHVKNKEDL